METAMIGRHAVVVGAGVAGLAAAAALADWFERVTVMERDSLPATVVNRPGTPQGWHAHGLLTGGQRALEALLPGLGEEFAAAGAVPLRINRDLREEHAHCDPMPQRDFGWHAYTMTRPLLETTLRQRVAQRANVVFRQDTRVLGLLAASGDRRVVAVQCMTGDGCHGEKLPADLVIDASGRGYLTMGLLQSIGRPAPEETAIGIDLGYTTAMLDIPDGAPPDWKAVLTHPDIPHATRRAVMLPVEGHRWIMTVAGMGEERPPGEWEALLAYLRQLATPTIHNAVKKARPAGKLMRFGLSESVWRHFERLQGFPDGLIPVGDAICRFNPVYGQGMTVAAQEAALLHRLLAARAAERDPLAGLGQQFLAEARSLIETPWTMAAIPDLAFPGTRGERPADLEESWHFAAALFRLAARDAAVQRLAVEVWHMLKPRSVYQDPDFMRRIQTELADMADSRPSLRAA
jgi:2-polyprenyl-6-methoxyphenol hydroxylase-like FAD-dependent oxidoreductase